MPPLFPILNPQRSVRHRHCIPSLSRQIRMAPVTFQFNVAFTLPVNNKTDPCVLTLSEVWQGIKRGGRNPHDFAEYVASCDVLSGSRKAFRRRLTLAEGAVHTAAGATLDQDVIIADGLHVSVSRRLLISRQISLLCCTWLNFGPECRADVIRHRSKLVLSTQMQRAHSSVLLGPGMGIRMTQMSRMCI